MFRRALLATCCFVVVALACGPGIGAREGEGEGGGGEGEGEPQSVFTVECAACHAADGSGTVDGPQIQRAIPAFATFVVRNGHDLMGFDAPMPSFSTEQVSDAELQEIIAFLDDADRGIDGAAVYTQMCFNCHGTPGGNGGRVREDIEGASRSELEEIVRRGHRANNVADREYMPAFTVEQLSNAELAAIIDFLN